LKVNLGNNEVKMAIGMFRVVGCITGILNPCKWPDSDRMEEMLTIKPGTEQKKCTGLYFKVAGAMLQEDDDHGKID
jgi:hypothetical protein